jgi:hypothetical protein
MSSLWEKIQAFFSAVEDFCLPFVKQFMTAAGPAILAAAEQAVVALATNALIPNAAKKDQAFQMITDELKKQGIVAATSVINSAIEAAVAKSKADATG